MTLPAIPAAQAVTPAQIDDVCTQVETWASEVDDVHAIKDSKNRLAAIDEYLRRTTSEGRARMATAMRRLEVRIGQLLGPAQMGRPTEESVVATELSHHERSDFRNMAEHADTVEEVIANSTDENPASRRQVIAAIKDKEGGDVADRLTHIKALAGLGLDAHKIAADLGVSSQTVTRIAKANDVTLPGSVEAMAERWERAREMATQGYSSRQISKDIGVSANYVREKAREIGFEIPADAIVGRSRHIDHNRVVEQVVLDLEATTTSLDVIGEITADDLDLTRIDDWVTSLEQSLKSLTSFKKQLKEMTQ